MKREDMEQLPELEINRIAMEKNTKGVATKDAKLAQRIIYVRTLTLALCDGTKPAL